MIYSGGLLVLVIEVEAVVVLMGRVHGGGGAGGSGVVGGEAR